MTAEEFAKTLPYMSEVEVFRAIRSLSEFDFALVMKFFERQNAAGLPPEPEPYGEGAA